MKILRAICFLFAIASLAFLIADITKFRFPDDVDVGYFVGTFVMLAITVIFFSLTNLLDKKIALKKQLKEFDSFLNDE